MEEFEDPHEILDSLDGDIHFRVEEIKRAIRIADLRGDEDAGMRGRLVFLSEAPRTRYADELITHFTWCHGKLEADPERFESWQWSVVDQFDLVLGVLVDFHNVSLAEIQAAIGQMEQSYTRLELPQRRVAEERFTLALRTGDIERADHFLQPWLDCEKPESPEAAAWERIARFELLALQERYDEALKLMERNLRHRNGLSSDLFVWSVSHAMRPLYLKGREAEAAKYQRQALPLLRNEPTDALGAGAHIAFLGKSEQLDEAVEVFEEFLQPGMEAPDPDAHFRIFAASAGLCRRLAQHATTWRLKLPDRHPLKNASGEYSCQELGDWFETSAREIGTLFDRRNGNDYFNARLYAYYNY